MGPIMWGRIPVPYTASWTGEQPFGAKIEKRLGGWFLHEDRRSVGSGKPMLSTFHCLRAIEVLERDICQICRDRLPRERYCLNGGQTINGLPHITDGLPMCHGCTRLCLSACPHLRGDVDNWFVYRVGGFHLAPAILAVVDAPRGRPEVNAALTAHWRKYGRCNIFGTPKLALTGFRRWTAREFIDGSAR